MSLPLVGHAALTPTSWLRDTVAGFLRPNITTDTLRIPSLTGCDTIDTDADGDFACGTDGGGGGSTALDLGDNGSNESSGLTEIAVTGDTNSIFTEPSADKLLIAVGSDWPKADTADDLTCTDCIGSTEITDLYVFNTGDTIDGELQFGNGATSAGLFRWNEDTDNGSNYLRMAAPSAITTNQECTLENDASFIPDSCVGNGTDDDEGVGASSTTEVLFNNAGAVDGIASATFSGGNLNVTSAILHFKSDATTGMRFITSGITSGNIRDFTAPDINGTLALGTGVTGECAEWADANTLTTSGGSCGGGGAPDTADYLVGTANGSLSAEIVVGTSPGGELGGTWASPTLDDSVTTTGWVMGTFSGTTLTAGTVNIDLLDGVGAVDMDYGSADITDHTFTTDGTGTAEIVFPAGAVDSTEILDDTILEADLKAVDAAGDEECLTYESTVGDFEWQTCGAGGSGDIEAVGDVASGAAFNGTAGTILTFNDAGGDATLEYDNTNNWFEVSSIFNPSANDGATLGNATQSWSDLFLAEGGVINWDNGDATLTQTSNDITFAGISTFGVGTSTAVTLGTIELGAASDTTIARSSAGQATLEGVAIDTASNTLTLTNKTIASASNVLDSCLAVAVTDDFSNLTAGTAKISFRMPYAMTLNMVRGSLVTAATGGTLVTVDVNEGGTTVLSTKLTFDASELTTTTAATNMVISDSALADDALITIDIDAVGNTTPGNGLKISLCGTI